MKVKKINQREPTKVKAPDKTKASKLQKKKLYRQRWKKFKRAYTSWKMSMMMVMRMH